MHMIMMVVVMVVMAAMLVVDVALLTVRRVGEAGVGFQNTVQVKGVQAQHLVQRHVRALGTDDRCQRVEATQALLDGDQFLFRHQINLVQDDAVGKGHLLAGFFRVVQTQHDVFGVHQCGHAVQLGLGLDLVIDEEGLGHRTGVGQTGRLHNNGVKGRLARTLALHQAVDHADQVPAHGAANAAVVHFEHVFIGPDHQIVVDADLAKLIDDDGVALAMILGEDAVQQGGFTGTEVAGQDGDWGLLAHSR